MADTQSFARQYAQEHGSVGRALSTVETMLRSQNLPNRTFWEGVRSELALLKNRGEKAMPTDMPVEADVEQQPEEPVGAQVLRRVHADSMALLEEYDSWLSVLEHEGVKSHLEDALQELEARMTATEELFSKAYSEAEPLEGAMEEEEAEETEAETPAMPEGKDMEEGDTGSVPADSGEPPDESDEKALRNGRTKRLPRRVKAADPETVPGYEEFQKKPGRTGKETDFKSADPHNVPGYEEYQKKPGKTGSESDMKAMGDPEDVPGYEEFQDKPGHEGSEADVKFLPHHTKLIGESKAYLKELSEKEGLDDEDRMKSYHFHKGLGDIVQAVTGMGGGGDKSADPHNVPGYEENQNKPGHTGSETDFKDIAHGEETQIPGDLQEIREEAGEPMHPHVKAVKDASDYFGDLAKNPQTFGDEHRQKALIHHKAMDPIGAADNDANVQDDMVGQMDEKALERQMYELNQKLIKLHSRLS